MKFRGWYIPIWIAGLSCLIAGFVNKWYLIIFGIALIALPFILWFAVKPKKKEEVHVEKEHEPVPVEERREFASVSFDVVGVEKHQGILKKVYKIQESEEWFDTPSCVLYKNDSREGYAVYLEHDRIGEAEPNKNDDIKETLEKGELSSISYVVYEEEDDEDAVYSCSVTISVKLP